MQAESLDVLEKASVAPAQARAIVRAIEIELAGAKDMLAAKSDVLLLRQDIEMFRTELRSEMSQLATALRAEMSQLATALRAEMSHLATRAELAKLGAELQTELHRAISGSTRQMYMALLGQMAVTMGLIYFLVTQLR